AESDELITDLEVLMTMAREGFNIYPEERSAIFGNMTIGYTVPGYEGKTLDLSAHPDGVMIGPALTTAEFVNTKAKMVLAIEKGGLFTRFIEEKVHERFKALLINTAGQPPRTMRLPLRRFRWLFVTDTLASSMTSRLTAAGQLRSLRTTASSSFGMEELSQFPRQKSGKGTFSPSRGGHQSRGRPQ